MHVFLLCMVVVSTYQILTTAYHFNPTRLIRNFKARKNCLTLSAKPEVIDTAKMSKNKAKIEPNEISYDVTRTSGYVLEGKKWNTDRNRFLTLAISLFCASRFHTVGNINLSAH